MKRFLRLFETNIWWKVALMKIQKTSPTIYLYTYVFEDDKKDEIF